MAIKGKVKIWDNGNIQVWANEILSYSTLKKYVNLLGSIFGKKNKNFAEELKKR